MLSQKGTWKRGTLGLLSAKLSSFSVGQTWLPLLSFDDRVRTDEQTLPVAVSLPPGYLSMSNQVRRLG